MARISRKVAASLARRKKAFSKCGPNQQDKHVAVMPGSQNRKKGAAMQRSARR